MAKKTGAKKMPGTAEVKTKPIRVDLLPEVHQKFRVEAAKEGMSMASMVKRLVEEFVRRKAGGK